MTSPILKYLWTVYWFCPDSCFDFAWNFEDFESAEKISVCKSGFNYSLKTHIISGRDTYITPPAKVYIDYRMNCILNIDSNSWLGGPGHRGTTMASMAPTASIPTLLLVGHISRYRRASPNYHLSIWHFIYLTRFTFVVFVFSLPLVICSEDSVIYSPKDFQNRSRRRLMKPLNKLLWV